MMAVQDTIQQKSLSCFEQLHPLQAGTMLLCVYSPPLESAMKWS